MPRPLDTRLGRVEGQRIAAAAEHGAATIRPALRAKAAMGAAIRSALAPAGVDAADATSVLPTKPPRRSWQTRTRWHRSARTRAAYHSPTPMTALGRTILSPRSW